MSENREEVEFIERHLGRALVNAGRRGFAIDRSPGLLTSDERRQRVDSRLSLAASALTDLQQWLEDDDPEVAARAREAVHRCLQIAYTGDRPEPDRGLVERYLAWVDRRLGRVLGGRVDLDAPEPDWTLPAALRSTRRLGIFAVLALAVGVAVGFISGNYLLSFAFLVLVSLADTAEGSFSRVTRMRDPQMRWMSCVMSHLDDLVIMTGIAFAAPNGMAAVALGAALLSIFGSLVRVSALQAGYRFWRSPVERVVRFAAFLAFAISGVFGHPAAGVVASSSVIAGFGVFEIARVLRRVGQLRVSGGGFIFLTENGADCWSFEEVDEVEPDAMIMGSVKRR